MSTCAGVVVDALIEERGKHGRYPLFEICVNYDAICQHFPENREVAISLLSILEAIDRQLPDTYKVDFPTLHKQMGEFYEKRNRGPSIPLYEVVSVPKILIEILYQFYNVLGDEGYEVRKKLQENENAIFGLSQYARRTKGVPLPTSVDMEPDALAYAYLKGTPFELLFNTPVPFEIPKDKWSEHCIIIAKPGFGKSQLIGSYLHEALKDTDRAVVLLDPHGDLYQVARQRVDPDRLVCIDATTAPPLNVFDFATLDEDDAFNSFKFFLSSLAGGLSPKQETCILPLFALLKTIDGATLLTLHDIITERPKKAELSKFKDQIAILDDVHRDFFQNLFFTGSFQETRDSLQWKLIAALGKPTFRKMFSAKHNSIDLARFIEAKKVVLVRGNEKALGKDGNRIFLLFIVAQFYAAGKLRDGVPMHRRHLTQMFVDEAANVLASTLISDILVELRKYKFSLTLATQVWDQIAQEVKPAVLGATSIKCVGEVQYNDRQILSRDMATTPEFWERIRKREGAHSATWAFYISGITEHAVAVTCPYLALESMPTFPAPPFRNERPFERQASINSPHERQTTVLDSSSPSSLPLAHKEEMPKDNSEQQEPEMSTTDDDHIRPFKE